MHEFVSQAAQLDREMREEMLEKFARRIRDVPGVDAEIAVEKVWTRVEEKVEELEKDRKLFKEKQKEGFFDRRCGISDVLDFGKHAGKTFMEVYFCDFTVLQWGVESTAEDGHVKGFHVLPETGWRHGGQGQEGEREEGEGRRLGSGETEERDSG